MSSCKSSESYFLEQSSEEDTKDEKSDGILGINNSNNKTINLQNAETSADSCTKDQTQYQTPQEQKHNVSQHSNPPSSQDSGGTPAMASRFKKALFSHRLHSSPTTGKKLANYHIVTNTPSGN